MQVLYIYCDFHSSIHTASDMSIIISKQYNETEKIYDQGKFVQDMMYMYIKSEENEKNTNKLFYLMNNITLHICHDEYTAVTFDTVMTNNSWQQRE